MARVRLQCVLYAQINGVSAAAAHFGFHRSTVAKWLRKYIPGHPETLEEKSRAPHTVRQPETDLKVVEEIRKLRTKDPAINRTEIHEELCQLFESECVPSESTIGRILKRLRLTSRDVSPSSDDGTPSHGSWIGGLATALIVGFALSIGVRAGNASAADSASYTLYDQFPNDATTMTKESASYQLTEDSLTWHKRPLVSTNYILNGALSADEAEESGGMGGTAGGITGGSTGGGDSGGGGGGGRRGDGPTFGSSSSTTSASSSRSSRSQRPSAPELPGSVVPPTIVDRFADDLRAGGPGIRSLAAADERFFMSVDPLCAPCVREECPILRPSAPVAPARHLLPTAVAAIAGIISLAVSGMLRLLGGLIPENLRMLPLVGFSLQRKENERQKCRGKNKHARLRRVMRGCIIAEAIVVAATVMFGVFWAQSALAANIGPQTHVYNGRLLNSAGSAVTSQQKLRFSYWVSEDYQSGDVTGTGAINTAAAHYGGWYEVQTVTPDSNGYFSVKLGSGTALPSLASYSVGDLADLFIQVEVKAASAADTSYELLDADTGNSAVDRSPILSVPFALNADRIDQHDVGSGSGSIPLLQSGGLLPVAAMPGATNSAKVIIDNDNSATTDITLQFGQSLAKKLSYDIANSRFNFNASLNVQGDLSVSGLINGVDISALGTETGTYLRASSGGGLNLRVGGGSYRINGNVANFGGTGAVALRPSATNRVYFTGTGLTVTTGTFPTDKSYIPVAEVTTSAGAITSIDDRRVLSSDNREQTIERMFTPAFEHASYQGDASNNVGQLAMSHDNTNNHNFYSWTSTKTSLQDYDVFVRVPLSADFEHWDASSALQVGYRSTSANATDNVLAVQVYDTNGQPVTLGGTSSALVSTSWTTTDITFSGGTWTAGQEFLIKFTFQAKDTYQMHLGKMRLKYVDLLNE